MRILLKLISVAGVIGISLLAYAQTLPANPQTSTPDWANYASFFRKVQWFEESANQVKAQGRNDGIPRHYIAREAGLNAEEEARLKAIAADFWLNASNVQQKAQALSAAGVASGDQRYKDLQKQAQQIAVDHIAQVSKAFDPSRFATLNQYIRSTMISPAVPANSSAAKLPIPVKH